MRNLYTFGHRMLHASLQYLFYKEDYIFPSNISQKIVCPNVVPDILPPRWLEEGNISPWIFSAGNLLCSKQTCHQAYGKSIGTLKMGLTGLPGWWTEPFRRSRKKAEINKKPRKVKKRPSFTLPRAVLHGRQNPSNGVTRTASGTWSSYNLVRTMYGPSLRGHSRGRFLQGLNARVAERLEVEQGQEWNQWLGRQRVQAFL